MKKLSRLCLILLCWLPMQLSYANTRDNAKTPVEMKHVLNENEKSKIRADALLLRLNEIKSMDKTNLNRSEKKTLRKEVNTINKELVKTNGGIYLSVGAVLLVILLLIILL